MLLGVDYNIEYLICSLLEGVLVSDFEDRYCAERFFVLCLCCCEA